jgi:hypothetical protein
MRTKADSPNNHRPHPIPDDPRERPAFSLLIDGAPAARIDADHMIEICAAISCELRRLTSHRMPAPSMCVRRLERDGVAGLPTVRSVSECAAVAVQAVIRMQLGGGI